MNDCIQCKHCFVAYGYEPDSILMQRCKKGQEQFTLEDPVECPLYIYKR
jgi:hypothetical protein